MEATGHPDRYNRPIEIADGIFWVGPHEKTTNLHCNPYLIVEGDRAVLIDAGSRPDFAVVMMKILQTGISPEQIVALIYQHPDPDLCGSMSNMVDICANPELRIMSETENNVFISYYLEKDKRNLLTAINDSGYALEFNGRVLQFFKTPYAHFAGSFITLDVRTKTLFTSDLFGSIASRWELFTNFTEACHACLDYKHCANGWECCPRQEIMNFHKVVMPSEKALRYAMAVVGKLDFDVIAPQHGGVLKKKKDIDLLVASLSALTGVGIDGLA